MKKVKRYTRGEIAVMPARSSYPELGFELVRFVSEASYDTVTKDYRKLLEAVRSLHAKVYNLCYWELDQAIDEMDACFSLLDDG